MIDDDLDRILSSNDDIVPSSRFSARVMVAVQRDSLMTPIPFPWLRAVPLAIAGLVAVATLLIAVINYRGESAIVPVPVRGQVLDAAWAALALMVAFVAIHLSMKLLRVR